MKRFKKILEIFRKIVVGYVFYTFPFALIAFVIIPNPPHDLGVGESYDWVVNHIFSNTFYRIAVVQILLWVLVSLLYSVSLVFSSYNREIFIKKLSGIKERDEREVQVIRKAFRASYLTTMAILLFLLFMSIFKFEISKMSADRVEPGVPPGSFAMGVVFEPYHLSGLITQKEGYDVYFEYCEMPLPEVTVILILLVWQIVSFRFVSRRALKVPD